MPEPTRPRDTPLLVGGLGPVRFAVRADVVEGVVGAEDLPADYASVCVPRLFDEPPTPARDARFARVRRRDGEAYLDLGGAVAPKALPADRLAAVPAVLGRTAARWGWESIAADEGGFLVVVDARLLAVLASPKKRGAPA